VGEEVREVLDLGFRRWVRRESWGRQRTKNQVDKLRFLSTIGEPRAEGDVEAGVSASDVTMDPHWPPELATLSSKSAAGRDHRMADTSLDKGSGPSALFLPGVGDQSTSIMPSRLECSPAKYEQLSFSISWSRWI
jgi:hypothetical protein